ncbi:MurR/RpiR family transcriptional regulator [Mesoplasma syrphidae]|uniref:MurR/RpiR family transcriptional regulator n=1 Tax=Mesoplasma syrphidae TaxID=225999 RepID=A0A2K9BPE3_9MOLU|nr:MurR/RpiR family transcriptional regulator [Mesoplasma syrphidae]AUF83903.1 MurR/RpiR family transcriptional regulator [Mesoplasma syrphidae]
MEIQKIISKIKLFSQDTNSNYALTSRVILENMETVVSLSISKVAQMAYTSSTSITRFCQQGLELDGFGELQTIIKLYLKNQESRIIHEEATRNESMNYKSDEWIFNEAVWALEETRELINDIELEKLANEVKNAKVIAIIAFNNGIDILPEIVNKLSMVGLPPVVIQHREVLEHVSDICDESWLFITITYFGERKFVAESLAKIKQNGSKIALISINHQNDYVKHSDIWIQFSGINDSDPLQMTRYSTLSALLYTFQICFIKILRNDPERFRKIYRKCKIDVPELEKEIETQDELENQSTKK